MAVQTINGKIVSIGYKTAEGEEIIIRPDRKIQKLCTRDGLCPRFFGTAIKYKGHTYTGCIGRQKCDRNE